MSARNVANIHQQGVILTSGATSTNAALPYNDEFAIIYNSGTGLCYVNAGPTSAVTATTSNAWVPPGGTFDLRLDRTDQFIAVYAPTGGGQINVMIAQGI